MSCDVCCGQGRYPIHNKYGRELYTIPCPECEGIGLAVEEVDAALEALQAHRKYDAAMAEKRAASGATE